MSKYVLSIALLTVACLTFPDICLASVESSLSALQAKLISTLLPMVAILGLVFAAFSFVMGNPNAKQHCCLAMVGAGIGFGAPAIISLIRSLIH